MSSENGQPSSCATLSFTRSNGCGGFWSSKYLFNCQVFTTPPRFDSSTRYSALSTTTVFSSLASATVGLAAAAAFAAPDFAAVAEEEALPVAPCCEPCGLNGAELCAGFACGGGTGGLEKCPPGKRISSDATTNNIPRTWSDISFTARAPCSACRHPLARHCAATARRNLRRPVPDQTRPW